MRKEGREEGIPNTKQQNKMNDGSNNLDDKKLSTGPKSRVCHVCGRLYSKSLFLSLLLLATLLPLTSFFTSLHFPMILFFSSLH